MNCREQRSNLMELARGDALEEAERRALCAHLEGCPNCAELFDRQSALAAAVRKLAAEAAAISPPEILESSLLAKFDRAGGRRRRRAAMRWIAAGAVAASLLAGWFLIGGRAPSPSPSAGRVMPRAEAPPAQAVKAEVRPPAAKRSAVSRRRAVRRAVQTDAGQPFIAIPYTEPLGPYERASVMRVDLPVAAVIAAGLPVRATDLGARARADVVVGQDGRARAIRLLSISTLNSDRRMNQ